MKVQEAVMVIDNIVSQVKCNRQERDLLEEAFNILKQRAIEKPTKPEKP